MGLSAGAGGVSNDPAWAGKIMTFTGAAGLGAVGAVPLFTVTGSVVIEKITAICTTTLVGAAATLVLGATGSTSLFIGSTVATAITTSAPIWNGTTPAAAGQAIIAAMKDVIVVANIIATAGVANVTAGVIRFDVLWRPLSANGNIA